MGTRRDSGVLTVPGFPAVLTVLTGGGSGKAWWGYHIKELGLVTREQALEAERRAVAPKQVLKTHPLVLNTHPQVRSRPSELERPLRSVCR
jgi:hypothetical protein